MSVLGAINPDGSLINLQCDTDGALNVAATGIDTGVLSALPTSMEVITDTTSATPNAVSTVTFAATSASVFVQATGNDPVDVSFDGGASYKTLTATQWLQVDIRRASIRVKSSAASAAYEILVGSVA
jgi:hypothetical protein